MFTLAGEKGSNLPFDSFHDYGSWSFRDVESQAGAWDPAERTWPIPLRLLGCGGQASGHGSLILKFFLTLGQYGLFRMAGNYAVIYTSPL
jgi:hypothetical protein